MRNRLLLILTILGVCIAPPLASAAILWEDMAPLNYARNAIGAVASGGKIYALGGSPQPGQIFDVVESYDPATNTWTEKARMPSPRAVFPVVAWTDGNGKEWLFAISGSISGYDEIPQVDAYDTQANLWVPKASLPSPPRNWHNAVVVDNKINIIGGGSHVVPARVLDVVDVYDPATDTWEPRNLLFQLPEPRMGACAVALDGRIYSIGAEAWGGSILDTLILDPNSGSGWSIGPQLQTPRTEAPYVVVDKKIYFLGGWDPAAARYIDTVEVLDTSMGSTASWQYVDAPLVPHRGHIAAAALGNSIYVVGGRPGPDSSYLNWVQKATFGPNPVSFTTYLHGVGSAANPPTLFLDDIAPTSATAKYKDSTSVNFAGGNPWATTGTWTAQPILPTGSLSALSGLRAWVGLKNSDDIGTQFDLRAEVFKNGTLVASGVARCLTGITRNPALAKEVTVAFDPLPPVEFDGAMDTLSLTLSTRIGTNPDDTKCIGPGGSHHNARGLRLYLDAESRASQFGAVAP